LYRTTRVEKEGKTIYLVTNTTSNELSETEAAEIDRRRWGIGVLKFSSGHSNRRTIKENAMYVFNQCGVGIGVVACGFIGDVFVWQRRNRETLRNITIESGENNPGLCENMQGVP
ncbi:MAG: hypothetical protein LBC02_03325, partial [Planctomycetaceae bacterium]|nr:hypothetical protein [Planctomycetaceae bacterium]